MSYKFESLIYYISRIFLHLNFQKLSKLASTVIFTILIWWVPMFDWSKCSTSSSILNTMTSDQYTITYWIKYDNSFSGYTVTGHYGIAPGPISNSMYYLDTIQFIYLKIPASKY